MHDKNVGAIILAAGKGTRMRSNLHKVLHPVGGRPMLHILLQTLQALHAKRSVVVVGAGREQVESTLADVPTAVQDPQMGTGHAVMCAEDAMADFEGDTFILYGDVPLIREETLAAMLLKKQETSVAGVVLGFRPDDAGAYGRLVLSKEGALDRIVEFKDANAAEKAITLCNSGIMCVDNQTLFMLLKEVTNDNAAKEYYLTDIVEVAHKKGLKMTVVESTEDEVMGVNSREELAKCEKIFQKRMRDKVMAEGATLIDPDSVFFSADTVIGKDVVIEPNVIFGANVTVGNNVRIYGFSHIEGTTIEDNAFIGPFARLRPGAHVGVGAKVGNFVEMKKSILGAGAKANHFTYLGDTIVGEKANIGAGTITCNYDGFDKFPTKIGAGAFIGSNSALVAPVTIGAGAIVGAGSVVSGDVADNALVLTRAEQVEKSGWASKFRASKQKK